MLSMLDELEQRVLAHISLLTTKEVSSVNNCSLKIRKMGHREVGQPAQGHEASELSN